MKLVINAESVIKKELCLINLVCSIKKIRMLENILLNKRQRVHNELLKVTSLSVIF